MNVNQNNQEIDLFAIPDGFQTSDITPETATKLAAVAGIPERATHVMVQCTEAFTYAFTAAHAADGFYVPANTAKIFSRRDARAVYIYAAGENIKLKTQPLSHD